LFSERVPRGDKDMSVCAQGATIAVGVAIYSNSGVKKQIIGGDASQGGGGASHSGGGASHSGGGGDNDNGGLRWVRRLDSSMPWKGGRGFPIACRRFDFEGKFH
jgi:hypothetical protein